MRLIGMVGVLCVMWSLGAMAQGDWEIPLHQKAQRFEEDVLCKHWLNGLYIAQIERCHPKGIRRTTPPRAARTWHAASTGRATICRGRCTAT